MEEAHAENGIGTATVLKDGGDDLDCTHRTPVVVTAELTEHPGLVLKAGHGVGTVTKTGASGPCGITGD